ncbi:MAG: 2-succinyl-5-enolpyruvyl-6-hydroxy-3-cyclohexene-1-carboxylate synthase [Chlamydiae bacterium]|nr:2-succinyl-5-enolpyruvyl-6-hydroxy-3-cyclohexene-1-carboxylate synthase [Chlamydiota bacterium]
MKVHNFKAHVIIEELIRLGVDYFCIAPGSRSTPLTYEVAIKKELNDLIHYDERGLAFHALGYAKATNKPAVIVITSGSSLANVFPAVIEAHYSSVPLIILSGDRPHELIDCGSNQAIDQVKFFQKYVEWQSDLPLCDNKLPIASICSTVDFAYSKANLGPVHLNCHFREPFLQDEDVLDEKEYQSWKSKTVPYCNYSKSHLTSKLCTPPDLPEKGAIILGKEVEEDDLLPIIELSKKLEYPIFSDILAAKSPKLTGLTIENYETIIKSNSEISFDCILQFGHAYLSKALLQRLKNSPPLEYHLISKTLRRSDPNHLSSTTHIMSSQDFCGCFSQLKASSTWIDFWKSSDHKISKFLNSYFENSKSLTEPSTLKTVFANAKENDIFYIASSMPIRDALTFGASPMPIKIFCNRGASGTDGNLATAFGVSQGADKPVTIVIGDVAFLYDLNSLAMIEEIKHPPTIVVINNSGCGVFSFLPISNQKEIFKRYFQAEHPFVFKGAAEQFNLEYSNPQTNEELQEALTNRNSKGSLIEITTMATENFTLHKTIESEVQNALA